MIDLNTTTSATCAVAEAIRRAGAPLGAGGHYLRMASLLESSQPKTAADWGFAVVKYDDGLEPATRDTLWWASQACKKHLGLTAEDALNQSQMSKDAIAGFLARNQRAGDVRIWWPFRNTVRELLRAALPEIAADAVQGRFGPGACFEGLDNLTKWGLFQVCDFDPQRPDPIPTDVTETYGFVCPKRYLPEPGGDRCARLAAVPKDNWRMRLISVEPGRNSFLQQFVRSLLMESIHVGVLRGTPSDFLSRFDNVEKQRLRCVRSSRTLHMSTIDLKDASDYISAEDVWSLFPPWIIPWLEMSRTPYVLDPYTGQEHRLWMYGGMGNATTFLVETLLFWATFEAIGSYLRCEANATVFGDDVILNSTVAAHPLFRYYTEQCGFILNRDKSCIGRSTKLREACGIVAYDGRPLTRLIRVQSTGVGMRGRIGLCDLANRLALSNLAVHQTFRDLILEGNEVPRVHTHPRSIQSAFGREDIWPNPTIAHLLERGDPTSADCTDIVPDIATQTLKLRTHTLGARVRTYRKRYLSSWQAMAVISGQVHTSTDRRGKLRIEVPLHPQTRVKRLWVSL